MSHEFKSAALRVEVRGVKGEVLGGASVVYRPRNPKTAKVKVRFEDTVGLYVAGKIPIGDGDLDVKHDRLERQSRAIRVGSGDNHQIFLLGEPGVRTYFREKVRVPVAADPDLVAVTLAHTGRQDASVLDDLARQIGLEPRDVPELAKQAGVRLYRAKRKDLAEALERLSAHDLVEHAGAVVEMHEDGFSHLTRDIVVRFQGPSGEEVRAIAKEHGYSVVRDLVYAPRTYQLRWGRPASLEILDSIEEIAARDDVEWAEPSLVVTPELDAITPTDRLWPGLWDRQLIGVDDAWQRLQNDGLDTFGDPDIVLAVWDSGVQSAAGIPTNADFSGVVSNALPKVLATYDFENMVANNDSPWNPHGSGVAGVSTGLANNAAPVAGETFGLTGSAPNVRIMTIAGRIPYVDIEVADQYIWMAGFDPQSPLAGFPAAPPPNGADVITCSLTPGAGSVLSGTAKATLDFVTTFGRGGKGTLCFFSTGNANANNVTARPYGAYEKCFAIAGTSIDNDGVTEIRAPYSGWGQIDLCAPTQDAGRTTHNPPAGYMPWSAAHAGAGNLPSFVQTQTSLAAASAAGATVLSVAGVAGFAVNAITHVGAFGGAGSEPARVTAVNPATNQLTVQGFSAGSFSGGLLNAHANGTIVVTGPAGHRNNFGGTSSATPLAAGVAALVLSANPGLTFIEARQILWDSALKFDLANVDPNGQWLDVNGNSSVVSGLPPVRSGWYGYGRVDADAAVQTAISFAASRDLVVRDNLADTGAVAVAGAFWNSPDIWCRRDAPGADPGAIPANYATAGPHQDPLRGQANWVYLRVRNTGLAASLDAWVRVSITHYPGLEFTYPASFQPTNGPGDPLPSPMTPGTYFIGEAKVSAVAPGGEQIVNVEWPAGLIPPETVATPAGPVNWHPCLLAEITPHDGPTPTGNHVWDDNNLAQKNISIVDTDAGTDFAMAVVIGHEDNDADRLVLEVNRGRLPSEVGLYVDLLDPVLHRRFRMLVQESERPAASEPNAATICCCSSRPGICICCPPSHARVIDPCSPRVSPGHRPRRPAWVLGRHEGREVVFLEPQHRVSVPIPAGKGRLSLLILGGIVGHGAEKGEYEVVLVQRQPPGEISGSATLALRIGGQG